jgi:hypothetical protein
MSFAFPNIDHSARFSSSVEAPCRESVDSTTGVPANYDFYSILSKKDLHHNRTQAPGYNRSSRGHSTESGTIGLPMDATKSRSRKICPPVRLDQRTRRSYPAALPCPAAPCIQRAAAQVPLNNPGIRGQEQTDIAAVLLQAVDLLQEGEAAHTLAAEELRLPVHQQAALPQHNCQEILL